MLSNCHIFRTKVFMNELWGVYVFAIAISCTCSDIEPLAAPGMITLAIPWCVMMIQFPSSIILSLRGKYLLMMVSTSAMDDRPASFAVQLHAEHWTINNSAKFLYHSQIAVCCLFAVFPAHSPPVHPRRHPRSPHSRRLSRPL